MLQKYYTQGIVEAGCDEAGRGCLAGAVFAAAVILPFGFAQDDLTDSKKLSPQKRYELRTLIKKEAVSYGVGVVSPAEIDEINILNASFLAMHRAIDQLDIIPELLLIDGNRFSPYKNIRHKCIVKGDSKYMSIAAASVLAKTYRDDYMLELAQKYPQYQWERNKGYPTGAHKKAIAQTGLTELHRKTFNCE